MLKDFIKIETFLTVVRERSFSKASAKLGISQPAVTQQIKFIEKYLDTVILERKKNGIRLTASGEELYKIAIKLESEINRCEQDLLKIIGKELTFRLGASFTIGTYLLPGQYLSEISESINNDVNLQVENSEKIIQMLKDDRLDLGIIEAPVFDNELVYREWMEDELVIASNRPMPKTLHTQELYEFDWICREEGSHTRGIMSEVFGELGVSCKSFKMISEVSNTTVALQTIKKANKNSSRNVVTILSGHAIADELDKGELFCSRIKGYTMKRKFYIAYAKTKKHNAYIDKVVNKILIAPAL